MSDLRTDFKDDVLNITTNEKRKYRMINNADGTVSFEDVTDYVQQGDTFGATEVNQITEKVNSCLTRQDVVDNLESTATELPLSANIGRELKEKLEWKLVGEIVGANNGTTISLPTDTYDEFLIIIGTPTYKWSLNLTKDQLNTFTSFIASAAHPSTNQTLQYARSSITANNVVTLDEVWQNGTNNAAGGRLTIYGR